VVIRFKSVKPSCGSRSYHTQGASIVRVQWIYAVTENWKERESQV